MVNPDPSVSAASILRPGPTRPGRWGRSEATKRAVLDAAGSLFAEKGYEDTSIDDIVKASGVSVGSIYHQFSGKADVFLALASEHFDRHVQASTQAMKKAAGAGLGSTEVYLAGAEAFLMNSWRDRDVTRLLRGDQGPAGYARMRREAELRLVHGASRLRLVGDAPTPDWSAEAVIALMNAAEVQIVEVDTVRKARRLARYFLGLIRHLVVEDEG